MDQGAKDIGERIRASIPAGMTQRWLAEHAEMSPDALSRALNGHRGFATVELMAIADLLDVDLYWLISGRPDPRTSPLAARHEWDGESRKRVNPDSAADREVMKPVLALYTEAYPREAPPSSELPADPEVLRERLGDGFVRSFASLVEERLGVDVVRLPDLGTAYSLQVGERAVIFIPAERHWYRSNWSLAHELGHLALGHPRSPADDDELQAVEREANRFAVDLLLPRALMRAVDWESITTADFARFVWDHGVSVQVLRNRLAYLKIDVPAAVTTEFETSTPKLLQRYRSEVGLPPHAVIEREQDATARRFPSGLLEVLTERVDSGRGQAAGLAWALGVPESTLLPDDETLAAEFLSGASGSAVDWDSWSATHPVA